MLEDTRVTALGLYIEGVGDLRAFEALAAKARALGKHIVAVKTGRSVQARAAAQSHTASLSGEDAGATALLRRLGVARAFDLPTFLETLKIFHVLGPLASNAIASLSCSGGEASLVADTASDLSIHFPALNSAQRNGLRGALGPMVALANPLDYHTYVWRDTDRMADTYAAISDPTLGLTLLVLDLPRSDRADPAEWDCALDALMAAKARTGAPFGIIATLPELLPEAIADRFTAAGIVPLHGLREGLSAIALAAAPLPTPAPPVCLPSPTEASVVLTEAAAKDALAEQGLVIPKGHRAQRSALDAALVGLGRPLALKAEGAAHKTEAGAVALGLETPEQVHDAARQMPGETFLIEEMVPNPVTELLIGVIKDPAHGFLMTLGAGGTLTELWSDTASFLLPASETDLADALAELRIAPILDGYRGSPGIDRPALYAAIRAIEAYVLANADIVEEVEVNPLICTSTSAIAADALIRRKETPDD